jgi:hypothetical protein
VKSQPSPATEGETYEQFRERLLVRWCSEKNSHGWCTTFDNIMVRNLGYTAKEVRAARGKFDYYHSAVVTLASTGEITKPKRGDGAVLTEIKKWVIDYFGTEDPDSCTVELELVSAPTPEPTDLSELDVLKSKTLKSIISNANLTSATQMALLQDLGFSADEVRQARTVGKYQYTVTFNWHSPTLTGQPVRLPRR